MTARDDQREVNNLPKLHEEQQQGRMLVIDEAKAARIVSRVAIAWEKNFKSKVHRQLD